MFLSILHRMILWELAKVFILSLVGITGILLMAGMIAEASQQGLGPSQILAIIPFLVPSTLPYTIPATTLFATCVVYGRLAADNEILAIRAAGINILKVVFPAFLLGLVMSCATMGLYYRIIPYTHLLMRTMFLKDVEELLYAMLRKDRQIAHKNLSYAIWIRQVQDRKLIDPVFKHRDLKDLKGSYDVVAWAREAELRVDMAHKQILVRMHYGQACIKEGDLFKFENRDWQVPLPDNFLQDRPVKPRDMTWQQILQRREDVIHDEEKQALEISQLNGIELQNQLPDQLHKHRDNLVEKRKYTRLELNSLNTELQMRPALAFGCLCFVVVGCPVGIWFSKSDYLSAFITCFLPVVFLYYPLVLCGTNMAKEGKFPPLVAVWAADAVVAVIAVPLYWRLLKH